MKRIIICLLLGSMLALLVNGITKRVSVPEVAAPSNNDSQEVADGRFIQQPATQGKRRVDNGTSHSNSSEKMHYTVLQSFKEAIGNNWMATIRVRENSRQVAMGAIVDRDGYAITKASEIKGDQVECQLYDGTRVAAKVVTRRSDVDLALLQLKKTSLPVLDWTESNALNVGKWLATTDIKSLPMAIGVVSVAPRTIKNEKAVLGVSFEWGERGNTVTMVLPGSGADRAGVRVGDVVQSINGKTLNSRQDMLDRIGSLKAGNRIDLGILRKEDSMKLGAELMDLNNTLLDPTEMEVNGEISARSTGFQSALQHDTVLARHQCGGPLVDLSGKAVGINIARAGRVSSYAIPASIVQSTVQEMLASVKTETLVSKEKDATVIRAQDSSISN